MICGRLSFSICFAVLREYSRKLALTVETDRVNFHRNLWHSTFAECPIVTAINWVLLQVFRRSSLRLRLRRGWSSLRHWPTDTESRGKERRTELSTFSRQPYSVFAGRICSPIWEHQTWGYRQLCRGTVKAITQCGRIMIPRAEVDRLLCSAKPYNGKIQSSRPARFICR